MLTLLPTDCINILNNILKGWVCPEGCKQVTLVQKSVDQVRVMVQWMGNTWVDDLQHHPQNFLQDIQILQLLIKHNQLSNYSTQACIHMMNFEFTIK